MKVIGIVGSPRPEGNTATLVEQVLKGAEQAGAQTAVFHVNKMNIRGCQGCYKCKKQGSCAVQDDMAVLYEQIDSADAVVFGSPVYMWQMTAQLKTVIDRLFAYMQPDYTFPGLKGKKAALVFAQGQPNPDMFAPYIQQIASLLRFMQFNVAEPLIAPGTTTAGSIKENTTVMQTALELGKKLAGAQ
ncbi:flavodoxin family protein [Desulfurispora thermophila]|uniref:flavodoxin family protein n=1 Tax=Desulfurispora thermophila TaxID=265470 RepID=UPI00036E001E|nr:flavodoxin family protein [Desulfurispora thermophila]